MFNYLYMLHILPPEYKNNKLTFESATLDGRQQPIYIAT